MKKQARIKQVLTVRKLKIRRSSNFELSVANLVLRTNGVVCVVGANGSGKTTLLESVVGLLLPDSGEARIMGKRLSLEEPAAKTLLGYIPDDDGWIIAELTAREYFTLHRAIYRRAGVKADLEHNVEDLAEHLLFSNFDQPLGALSHGNKRKVQIIAGLMHDPALIVVDELRNGLDPIAIKRAEDLIKRKSRQGTAVLAATHDLWWAERFAEEVIMIKNGSVLLQEATSKIIKSAGSVENKFMELYA